MIKWTGATRTPERFAMSGVLASVAAGLMVGHFGWRRAISPAGRGHLLAFCEYAAFLPNLCSSWSRARNAVNGNPTRQTNET
jgi:hypothetical protein